MTVINRHTAKFLTQGSVYIGRPSKWGNPYAIGPNGNRETVLNMYRQYLTENPQLIIDAKAELTGHDLVCFCAPLACHGDILEEVIYGDSN